MNFEIGDLVKPTGARISVTCPSEDIGVVIELMTTPPYTDTGRTVRVYWQRNKRKALVCEGWLEKIENFNNEKLDIF
jgi:hypothetical protein